MKNLNNNIQEEQTKIEYFEVTVTLSKKVTVNVKGCFDNDDIEETIKEQIIEPSSEEGFIKWNIDDVTWY